MHRDLRQLLEDLRERAAEIDRRFFTRHPLVIATATARDESLVSVLDLQPYLDRIADTDRLAETSFETAALAVARAWFAHWDGASTIERGALPVSANHTEMINAGLVLASIDAAVLMSGDPPGWDNVERRPV